MTEPQALPDRETLLRWAGDTEPVYPELISFLESDALWSALEVARAVAWCESGGIGVCYPCFPRTVPPGWTVGHDQTRTSEDATTLPSAVAALKAKLAEGK